LIGDCYGNDGALKAVFKRSLRRAGLLSGTESGSCGAPCLCVHRAIRLSSVVGVQKRYFCLISRENVTSADTPMMHRSAPYYCIARGGELWFERLDFDAF